MHGVKLTHLYLPCEALFRHTTLTRRNILLTLSDDTRPRTEGGPRPPLCASTENTNNDCPKEIRDVECDDQDFQSVAVGGIPANRQRDFLY